MTQLENNLVMYDKNSMEPVQQLWGTTENRMECNCGLSKEQKIINTRIGGHEVVVAYFPEFASIGAFYNNTGREVIATSAETIRIRASMYAAVNVDIVVANFRLGLNGGATLFNLVTKLNNGDQMDEALNFRQGFRLPGRDSWLVAVSGKQISSQYKLMSELYPVPSLWEVRMGENALVEMPFTVTINSGLGDKMRVRAPPYDLQTDFSILQSGTAEIVTSEVLSAASGELVARLSTQLFRGVLYEVRVRVLTPKNVTGIPRRLDEAFGDGGCGQNFNAADIQEFKPVSNPQKWVDAHNYYRDCHGSPPLRWDESLRGPAQAWVTKLLQHCGSGQDLEAWANAGSAKGRPHDPNLFTSERPQQGENLDCRQYDSIHDPEAASVEGWYRECKCNPKGSPDVFPQGWQKYTCKVGQNPVPAMSPLNPGNAGIATFEGLKPTVQQTNQADMDQVCSTQRLWSTNSAPRDAMSMLLPGGLSKASAWGMAAFVTLVTCGLFLAVAARRRQERPLDAEWGDVRDVADASSLLG
eukprot:g29381.t1